MRKRKNESAVAGAAAAAVSPCLLLLFISHTKVFFSCVCSAHKLLNFSYLNFCKYIIHAQRIWYTAAHTSTLHREPGHGQRCQFALIRVRMHAIPYGAVWTVYDLLFIISCLSCSKTDIDEEWIRQNTFAYIALCVCVCDLFFWPFSNAYFISYVRNVRGNNMFMMHFVINVECELAISGDNDHRLCAPSMLSLPNALYYPPLPLFIFIFVWHATSASRMTEN